MLLNFEQIVNHLKREEDPVKKAGPLINVAKVELEQRCATGYQAEIDQTLMLLDSQRLSSKTSESGSSLEAVFRKQVFALLISYVEDIVRSDFSSDSHAFTQMLYSVGLASSPDPLSALTVQECHEKIINCWNKGLLIHDFLDSAQRLSPEQLEAWFKADTPDDYGKEFFSKKMRFDFKSRKLWTIQKNF